MLLFAADGLPGLDLDDIAEGFVCEEWSIGPPSVRDVVEPRTLANGTLDWTQFVGARAVTLRVAVFPNEALGLTVQGNLDRLSRYCRPDLRPTLTWRWQDDAERLLVLRANPGLDAPYTPNAYTSVRVGLSFVAPDALVWAAQESHAAIYPTPEVEEGRSYNEAEIIIPGVARNLLASDAQASVETGATVPAANLGVNGTWQRWGGDQFVARDPAVARIGTSSLVMTRVTAGAAQSTLTPPTASSGVWRFPVTPGHLYQVLWSHFVEAASADKRVQLSGEMRDAGAVSLGSWTRLVTAIGGTWEDKATEFLVAPGAVDCYLSFAGWPAATTGKWWLDRVALYDLGEPPAFKLPSESDGRNILTDQQASIEAGPTTPTWDTFPGWRGSGSSVMLSRATDRAYVGSSCLMVNRVGTSGSNRILIADDTGNSSYRVTVQPNTRYWFSAWSMRTGLTANQNFVLSVNWYDAANAALGTSAIVTYSYLSLNDVWTPHFIQADSPPGAVKAQLYIDIGASVEGQPCYIDALHFGPAPDPLPFSLPSQGIDPAPTGTYGREYDRAYPHVAPSYTHSVNAGQVAVPWEADIYGPCTNPRLINDTTGEGLYFTANGGLTLLPGEVLHLDSAARTAYIGSTNRYDKLDIVNSRWFTLAPGDNNLMYLPSTFGVGSVCDLSWRAAWL